MALKKAILDGVSVVVDDSAPTTPVTNLTEDGGDIVAANAAVLRNVRRYRDQVFTVAASDSSDAAKDQATYVCDGTDDQSEINAAITAAASAGGGIVLLRAGTYNTTAAINPADNVWIKGEGWNTIISGTGTTAFSLIGSGAGGRDTDNPWTEFWVTDLKLDCANVTPESYNTSAKGIFLQFMVRCRIQNVWVKDSFATGIGTDYMVDCWIDGCLVTGAGRGSNPAGSEVGSNGIGIGTGEWAEETLVISNCHVRDCKNNGIMFEDQQATSGTIARYMHVVNCTMEGNYIGARVSGVESVTFANCSIANNETDGIFFDKGLSTSTQMPKEIIVSGCQIRGNGSGGIDQTGNTQLDRLVVSGCVLAGNNQGIILRVAKNVTITGNHIYNNTAEGVLFRPHSSTGDVEHVTITGNEFDGNGTRHIAVSNKSIRHLLVDGNYFKGSANAFHALIGLTVENTLFSNNVFISQTDSSIEFEHTLTNVSIRGNRFIAPAKYGVETSNNIVTGLSIDNNDFIGGKRAVYVRQGTGVAIRDNIVRDCTEYGIIISPTGSGQSTSDVKIEGNLVSGCTQTGIAILPVSSATVDRLTIANNQCYANGQGGTAGQNDGIVIGNASQTVNDVLVTGNMCYDDQVSATQRYGIFTQGTVNGLVIRGNMLKDNATGALSHTATGTGHVIEQNEGYNPLGMASISVGSSPYEYTAGPTPEVVYIHGGTVSNVSKGETTIADGTGVQVTLRPNESVTVTYSDAPTMVKDRL